VSNHLAIATVSSALGNVVSSAVQGAVAGTSLRFGRPVPPAANGEKRVHVYLFQITPNASLRNADLPSRGSDFELSARPRAALDLHYLLTFYGDDEQLEPARMAGAVARDLHANPVLGRQALLDASVADLGDSDLASAVERVRITPTSLSLDELSKLWSVLTQTPHALSLVYQVSVVVLDGLVGGVQALPVLQRGLNDELEAGTSAAPRLESLWIGNVELSERRPLGASLPTAALGARLVVRGANLGAAPRFELLHRALAPQTLSGVAAPGAPSTWLVDLPQGAAADAAFASGVYELRALVGSGSRPASSNVLPLGVRPRCAVNPPGPFTREADGSVIVTLDFHPRLQVGQLVTLLVGGREVTVQTSIAASQVTFDLPDAPLVTDELLRVRVDGVESLPLVYDPALGRFVFDDTQRITIA
jgi:Pvc16 N-terminal domain